MVGVIERGPAQRGCLVIDSRIYEIAVDDERTGELNSGVGYCRSADERGGGGGRVKIRTVGSGSGSVSRGQRARRREGYGAYFGRGALQDGVGGSASQRPGRTRGVGEAWGITHLSRHTTRCRVRVDESGAAATGKRGRGVMARTPEEGEHSTALEGEGEGDERRARRHAARDQVRVRERSPDRCIWYLFEVTTDMLTYAV